MTKAVRQEYNNYELPIIMITCNTLEEDVIRGLDLGANDYMTKPLRCKPKNGEKPKTLKP